MLICSLRVRFPSPHSHVTLPTTGASVTVFVAWTKNCIYAGAWIHGGTWAEIDRGVDPPYDPNNKYISSLMMIAFEKKRDDLVPVMAIDHLLNACYLFFIH